MFAEPTPPEVLPHDPSLLTLVDAARLVHREPGTVRGWVKAGDLAPHLGRYREADVLAVAARKRGEAA